MTWHRPGDKPLSEPMMASLLMHICVTRPQWVNRACCSLPWHHNEYDGISNHQPNDWLLNRLFRHRSKKTSKLRVTGLCAGNSPVTSEIPIQGASNMEKGSIWWHHHVQRLLGLLSWYPIILVKALKLIWRMDSCRRNCWFHIWWKIYWCESFIVIPVL